MAALPSGESSTRKSASSIQLSALIQDLMKQGSTKVPVTVDFPPRAHQYVSGYGDAAQTFLGALVASNRALVAARHDDHEVNVAVFIGRAPGVRAEQINLFGLKLGLQTFNDIFQKAGLNCFHGVKASMSAATLKAAVSRIDRVHCYA